MPVFNDKNPFYLDVYELAIQQTALDLLDSGVDANFLQPILSMLSDAVGTGANINDLIEKKCDVVSAYVSNEPYDMEEAGIEYKLFHHHLPF